MLNYNDELGRWEGTLPDGRFIQVESWAFDDACDATCDWMTAKEAEQYIRSVEYWTDERHHRGGVIISKEIS